MGGAAKYGREVFAGKHAISTREIAGSTPAPASMAAGMICQSGFSPIVSLVWQPERRHFSGVLQPRRKHPMEVSMARRLTSTQWKMITRRGLDPNNYDVIKDTITSLYLLDRRTGKVMILYKRN